MAYLEPREEMTDFEKSRKLKRNKRHGWRWGMGTIRGLSSYSCVNKQKYNYGQLIVSLYWAHIVAHIHSLVQQIVM